MAAPKNDRAGVRKVLRALKNAGADHVEFYDADYAEWVDITGQSEKDQIASLMDFDEVNASFSKGTEGNDDYDRITVFFVFGNAPDEVVCDYSLYREDDDSFSVIIDKLTTSWWD